MGATNFIDIKWTDDSLQGAYLHAVDEAYAEHGSAPYNGTISTTNGLTSSPPLRKGIPVSAVSRTTKEHVVFASTQVPKKPELQRSYPCSTQGLPTPENVAPRCSSRR